MATRYYTEEAYEQIKQTIEQIDNSDISPVKDFFSDLFLRLGQFLKLYSVEQYQNDIQTWYNKVLDSHDSTISAVDRIFNAVDTVDFEYRDIMNGAVESIVNFRSTLNCLRDVISGKSSMTEGKAAADGYVAAGKNALDDSYGEIITRMKEQVYGKALKEVIGDTIKMGMGFCKLFTTRDPVKYAVECKKFLDTFTATLYDLRALTSFIVLPISHGIAQFVSENILGIEWNNETETDSWFEELSQAQGFMDTNSVSDWLGGIAEDMDETLADCPESNPYYSIVKATADVSRIASRASEAADIAVDAYDIVSDMKDSHDTIDEWMHGKDYTEKEYAKLYDKLKDNQILDLYKDGSDWVYTVKVSPAEIIKKVGVNWFGVPTSGWNDPSKFDGNVYKTVGTIWSYAEKLTSGEDVWDVSFSKFKDTKFLKNVFDFVRDLDDFVSKPEPDGSPSGSVVLKTVGVGGR